MLGCDAERGAFVGSPDALRRGPASARAVGRRQHRHSQHLQHDRRRDDDRTQAEPAPHDGEGDPHGLHLQRPVEDRRGAISGGSDGRSFGQAPRTCWLGWRSTPGCRWWSHTAAGWALERGRSRLMAGGGDQAGDGSPGVQGRRECEGRRLGWGLCLRSGLKNLGAFAPGTFAPGDSSASMLGRG